MVNHASLEDLVVDKLLTLTNVGSFGRQRFKDLFDLGLLLRLGPAPGPARERLDLMARQARLSPQALLEGALEDLASFTDHALEVKGFAAMVARESKETLRDWEGLCLKAREALELLMSRDLSPLSHTRPLPQGPAPSAPGNHRERR